MSISGIKDLALILTDMVRRVEQQTGVINSEVSGPSDFALSGISKRGSNSHSLAILARHRLPKSRRIDPEPHFIALKLTLFREVEAVLTPYQCLVVSSFPGIIRQVRRCDQSRAR